MIYKSKIFMTQKNHTLYNYVIKKIELFMIMSFSKHFESFKNEKMENVLVIMFLKCFLANRSCVLTMMKNKEKLAFSHLNLQHIMEEIIIVDLQNVGISFPKPISNFLDDVY